MRISVTDLDAWEYYKASNLALAEYVRRLQRVEPPTPAMEIGTAFHARLEAKVTGNGPADPKIARHIFDDDGLFSPLPKPDGVEVPIQAEVPDDYGAITLSGRLDWMAGDIIGDWKTTSKSIDLERYGSAWQWRAYMYMVPRAQRFRYDVFQLYTSTMDPFRHKVVGHMSFQTGRYHGLAEEVCQQVRAYAAFLRQLEADGHIQLGPRGVVKYQPKEQA